MMSMLPIFFFGLVIASSMAQEPQMNGAMLGEPRAMVPVDVPQEFQQLRDFPYNPPTYGERKSHSKSFRPRIPLLRY